MLPFYLHRFYYGIAPYLGALFAISSSFRRLMRVGVILTCLEISTSVLRAEGFVPRRDFPITNGIVRALAIDPVARILYIGGDFSLLNPIYTEVTVPVSQENAVPRSRLAAIDLDTGAILSWNPGADGDVNEIIVIEGKVYVFGRFEKVGGISRRCAAAVDGAGNVLPWNPDFSAGGYNFDFDTVKAVGNVLYLSGNFTEVGEVPRQNAAAVDTNGNLLPWVPVTGTGYPSPIYGIANIGDSLFVGGSFDQINGTERNHLGSLDTSGTVLPWAVNADSTVLSLTANGNILYTVGWFRTIGGVTRQGMAAIDTTTGTVTDWQPDPDVWGSVFSFSNDVFVAGASTSQTTENYALYALNPENGHTISRTAITSAGAESLPGAIYTMAKEGTNFFIAGNFYTVAGEIRPFFTALAPAPTPAPPSNPSSDHKAPSLAVSTRSGNVTAHRTIEVRGKSSDDQGIALVEYRLGNKGTFRKAHGTTRWSFTAHLKLGRNVITVRAVDTMGRRSKATKLHVKRA